MPVINYGQTITSTQPTASGVSLIVAYGGAIATISGPAVSADDGTFITIAGQLLSSSTFAVEGLAGTMNMTVTETGIVQSTNQTGSPAIRMSNSGISLYNYGFIGGGGGGNSFGTTASAQDFIVNAGRMVGNVGMGGGNDTFIVRNGSITGTLDLGDGADLLMIDQVNPAAPLLKAVGGFGADILDMTRFAGALWIDLDYNGVEVWTRDDRDLASTNPWRTIADIAQFETVIGGMGSDWISGTNGSDTFRLSGGIDTIRGDGGVDVFDAAALTSGIWINLAISGQNVWTKDIADVNAAGGVWRPLASLDSIENVVGTLTSDYFLGDAADNTFIAAGNLFTFPRQFDQVSGGNGNDTYDARFTSIGAIWVDLAMTSTEVWTQELESVIAFPNAPWYTVANLASIESVVGTSSDDDIYGDGNANRLDGYLGSNRLTGRGGADTFVFNLSPGLTGFSTVTDFAPGLDKIGLVGLTDMPTITMSTSPVPMTGDDTILYNTGNGNLYYDSNGNQGGGLVQIATLTGGPALTNADFILI